MHGQKRIKLVLIQCRVCRQWFAVRVDPDDLAAHDNGALIQDAMPYLAPELRELFISQTCGSCWARLCASDTLA